MEDITAAVAALDYTSTVTLVREALDRGEATADIVGATQAGLKLVGERYERQDIFLSGLIMAGEIFRGVMETIRPDWEDLVPGESAAGRVLLGTVAGDIHDLGKNMAALAFRAFGFTVDDLGVDVPPEDVPRRRRPRPARHHRAFRSADRRLRFHAQDRGPHTTELSRVRGHPPDRDRRWHHRRACSQVHRSRPVDYQRHGGSPRLPARSRE